jgi:hypothetical protein
MEDVPDETLVAPEDPAQGLSESEAITVVDMTRLRQM